MLVLVNGRLAVTRVSMSIEWFRLLFFVEMKKALFILATIALFASNVRAQQYLIDKIALPDTGGEFGFYVDINVNEGASVLYDLQANSPDQRARAELSSSDVNSLTSSLEKAMAIYEKWTQLAKEKGLRLLVKKIPVMIWDQNIYFTQEGKWYYEKGVDMCAKFFVDEDGGCHFILESDYMTSSELAGKASSLSLSYSGSLLRGGIVGMSNAETQISIGRYCGGSSLMFKTSDEIKNFIGKLKAAVEWKKQNISDSKVLK